MEVIKMIGKVFLGLMILSVAAQAAIVTVSSNSTNTPANQLLNSGGTPLRAGAYVQVIRSSDANTSQPNPINGLPLSATDLVVSTGTLISPGTFTKGGNSVPTGNYVYIVAWESWDGTGTPVGTFGLSAISGAMTAASWIFFPASFGTITPIVSTPADTTPPTVISTTPSNGATGINTLSDVTVTFSEAMLRSTLASKIQIVPALTVENIAWNNVGGHDIATISFANFNARATYAVTIQSGVKDLANNGLASNYNFYFTTATVSNPTPTITLTTLPNGTVGAPYTGTLTASGGDGTYVWTLTGGTLPAGLTFNNGTVSGTPTESGSFALDVSVSSGGETAAGNVGLTITTDTAAATEEVVITSIAPAAAPAGTRVTVSGFNFGANRGTSTLIFQNYSLDYLGQQVLGTSYENPNSISWGDTAIEAIIPAEARAGKYNVRVNRQIIDNLATEIARTLQSNDKDLEITVSSAVQGSNAVIYPNPFNPILNQPNTQAINSASLAFNPGAAVNVSIYIYDMTARLVMKRTINTQSAVNAAAESVKALGWDGAKALWNGYDLAENLASDGAFMVRIIDEDSKQLIAKGKILVIKRR